MKLIIFILFFPLFPIAQQTGIHFEPNSSWAETKAKAKAENKFIFMNCFDVTAHERYYNMNPFALVEKAYNVDPIFLVKEVGNLMNDNFISVKMDNFKNYYTSDTSEKYKDQDGYKINKLYNIHTYPTYLFFDPEGNIVHRAVEINSAALFIETAKNAMDPEKQYYTQLRKCVAGRNDIVLRKTVALAIQAQEWDTAQKLVSRYLVSQENYFTKENLLFINNSTNWVTDIGFRILMENPEKVDSIIGTDIAEEKLAQIIMQHEALMISIKSLYAEPGWKGISKALTQSYPSLSLKMMAIAKIKWLEYSEDWHDYPVAINEYIHIYSSDFPSRIWNDYAWMIYLHSNNNTYLTRALEWSHKSLHNNTVPKYRITYSKLLFKLGKKEESNVWRRKAVELEDEQIKKGLPQQQL